VAAPSCAGLFRAESSVWTNPHDHLIDVRLDRRGCGGQKGIGRRALQRR
jgi:hypothetical protein